MPQMQHTGSPIWNVANAANDANATKQSRCDANAALTIWDADNAAKWRHADTAAIHIARC